MSIVILGVDPGITGALAIISVAGALPVEVLDVILGDMPVVAIKDRKSYCDGAGLRDFILGGSLKPTHAFIERVNAMPSIPDKVTGVRRPMGASSAFQFGDTFGSVRTAVAVCGIPYTIISSVSWKKHHGLGGQGKPASRRRAIELSGGHQGFSRVKDEGRAEAYLIAHYGAALLLAPPEQPASRSRRKAAPDDEQMDMALAQPVDGQ